MDLNYFIHNELLTKENAVNIARYSCNSDSSYDAFDELAEEDKQYYIDRAEHAIYFLQNQLMGFNAG